MSALEEESGHRLSITSDLRFSMFGAEAKADVRSLSEQAADLVGRQVTVLVEQAVSRRFFRFMTVIASFAPTALRTIHWRSLDVAFPWLYSITARWRVVSRR